jgi:hypothetical protein
MVWTTKGIESLPLSILPSIYRQRMLMALQRTHATFISRWVVIARELFSRLEALSGLPPLSLVDMLSCDWWKIWFLVDSFPLGGPLLLGLDFGPCPLFLFLFLSWVLCF